MCNFAHHQKWDYQMVSICLRWGSYMEPLGTVSSGSSHISDLLGFGLIWVPLWSSLVHRIVLQRKWVSDTTALQVHTFFGTGWERIFQNRAERFINLQSKLRKIFNLDDDCTSHEFIITYATSSVFSCSQFNSTGKEDRAERANLPYISTEAKLDVVSSA